MKVMDFVKYDVGSTIFQLVDATKVGYFTNPEILFEGDKNAVRVKYGRMEVLHYELKTGRKIALYVR